MLKERTCQVIHTLLTALNFLIKDKFDWLSNSVTYFFKVSALFPKLSSQMQYFLLGNLQWLIGNCQQAVHKHILNSNQWKCVCVCVCACVCVHAGTHSSQWYVLCLVSPPPSWYACMKCHRERSQLLQSHGSSLMGQEHSFTGVGLFVGTPCHCRGRKHTGRSQEEFLARFRCHQVTQ